MIFWFDHSFQDHEFISRIERHPRTSGTKSGEKNDGKKERERE